MSRVMVFGTFDGLHPGHLNFFKQAKSYGSDLIIVIARDKNVVSIKGHLPKYSEKERLLAVKKLFKNIDYVTVLLGQVKNPYAIIEKHKPKIICLGYDQAGFADNLKNEYPVIKVIRLKPYYPKIYKSSIINHKS